MRTGIDTGINNILGDLDAVGSAIAPNRKFNDPAMGRGATSQPVLSPEEIKKRLEFCKTILANTGRGKVDEAAVKTCNDFIALHDPTYGKDEPGGGGDTQGSVTGMALGLIYEQFPLYVSLPVIAYTLWHFRKIVISFIPFINHK